jgi:hypothetical protein
MEVDKIITHWFSPGFSTRVRHGWRLDDRRSGGVTNGIDQDDKYMVYTGANRKFSLILVMYCLFM